MATLAELTNIILQLPDTSEGTHFRLPCFKVQDKPFISVSKNQAEVSMSMDKTTIAQLLAERPDVYRGVWQSGKHLIGISFDIDKVDEADLRRITILAWKHKVPKKLS